MRLRVFSFSPAFTHRLRYKPDKDLVDPLVLERAGVARLSFHGELKHYNSLHKVVDS